MAKDRSGKKLRIGSTVVVPCKVTGLAEHPEGATVTLETIYPIPGGRATGITLGSTQVVLAAEDASKAYAMSEEPGDPPPPQVPPGPDEGGG